MKKWIANCWRNCQERFAGCLGKLTTGLGTRGKMVVLAVLCIVFGGLSLLSVVRVFLPRENKKLVIPGQVAVPKHFDKTGEPYDDEVLVVSPVLYKRLQEFRSYMDSLRVYSKQVYDSIMHARPGLMDSVFFLEQIYSEQKR